MAMSDHQIEAAANLLSVLGEPSRLRILRELWASPKSVGEIVECTGLKQSNVSRQLSLLFKAGVIARDKQGTSRHYSIALPVVRDLCALVCEGTETAARQKAEALRDV